MQQRAFSLTLCALAAAALAPLAQAVNLERSTITELVNDVSIINPATKAQKSAHLNEVFTTPNVMRTGPDSRVEMIAEDQTVTRVGANTLFSFEPNKREINLQRGSVLFNSPTGKGGGTIKTAAATAAVLGTTLIVVTTPNGGFKVLLIEGHGRVTGANGQTRMLGPGQMTFMTPGQGLSPIYTFQISEQAGQSKLVGGFRKPLPAFQKIGAAIQGQQKDMNRGRLIPTGLLAGTKPGEAYKLGPAGPAGPESRFGPAPSGGGPRPDPRNAIFIPRPPVDPEVSAARFTAALAANIVINGSLLNTAYLFALDDPEALARGAGPDFINPAGSMYLGNSISLNTPLLDLRTFPDNEIRLIAINDFRFERSATIASAPGQGLGFAAGGTFLNRAGTVINTNTPNTTLVAFGSTFNFAHTLLANNFNFSNAKPLRLTSFELVNTGGGVQVVGPRTILDTAGFSAFGALSLRSTSDLDINNGVTRLPAWTGAPAGVVMVPPSVANNAFSPRGTALEAGGPLNVHANGILHAMNSDFVSQDISVSAGKSLILTYVRFSNAGFNQNQGIVRLNAAGTIDIFGARFQAGNVNMSANTIILDNMSFSGTSAVTLKSALGQLAPMPNSGRTAVPGKVNFIQNVNYGASPAENFVRSPMNLSGPIIIK